MKKFKGLYLYFGIFVIFLWVAIVVSSGAGFNPLGVDWNFANPGTFGDSFGPISAFMAAVAAISAVSAFRVQQEELNRLRQREVEEDTRNAIADFERSFFQLLEHQRQITSSIDIDGGDNQRNGQDAFKAIAYFFQRRAQTGLDKAWDETFSKYSNDLGHYFRFLYHLIIFIDGKDFVDRYHYVRLVRAMLSEYEIFLLALNCALGDGREKFKPLIERYALLHNLSHRLSSQYNLKDKFEAGAFEPTRFLAASAGI